MTPSFTLALTPRSRPCLPPARASRYLPIKGAGRFDDGRLLRPISCDARRAGLTSSDKLTREVSAAARAFRGVREDRSRRGVTDVAEHDRIERTSKRLACCNVDALRIDYLQSWSD